MIGAWSIAKIKPDDKEAARHAVNLIVELLKSKEPRLRQGAAVALTELHGPSEIVGPALEEMMQDSDPSVRAGAIKAVGSMGAKAVPGAIKSMQNKKLRDAAVEVLKEAGPAAEPAVKDLTAALADPDPDYRREVQLALAAIGPGAAPATDALVKSLNADKQNDRVKYTACVALGRIGPKAAAALPSLEKGLKSDDPVMRLASMWAIFRIKPGDKAVAAAAVPLLITGLDHEKEAVREEIAVSLGDIGPAASAAVPALTKTLQDSSPAVRAAAEAALKKIKAEPKK
jgi:HEAT repeat protein